MLGGALNLGGPARLADRQDVIHGAGYRSARFDTFVVLDDAFQNPPAEIPWLAGALVEDIHLICTIPSPPRKTAKTFPKRRIATRKVLDSADLAHRRAECPQSFSGVSAPLTQHRRSC